MIKVPTLNGLGFRGFVDRTASAGYVARLLLSLTRKAGEPRRRTSACGREVLCRLVSTSLSRPRGRTAFYGSNKDRLWSARGTVLWLHRVTCVVHFATYCPSQSEHFRSSGLYPKSRILHRDKAKSYRPAGLEFTQN